jgi:hypothetical protein
MDPYALDFPFCAAPGGSFGRESRLSMAKTLHRAHKYQVCKAS